MYTSKLPSDNVYIHAADISVTQ